jgi:hypothetical protein
VRVVLSVGWGPSLGVESVVLRVQHDSNLEYSGSWMKGGRDGDGEDEVTMLLAGRCDYVWPSLE